MKYVLEFDSLQVGAFQLDASTNTKHAVLAQISKLFDPLPVSNKGKFLMRDLMTAKLEWDDMIPEVTLKKWSLHCTDLRSLSTLFFPRSCVNKDFKFSCYIYRCF